MLTLQNVNQPDVAPTPDLAAAVAQARQALEMSKAQLCAELVAAGLSPDGAATAVHEMVGQKLAAAARASNAQPAPGYPWLPSQVWQLIEAEMRSYVHTQQVQQRPYSRLDCAQAVYEALEARGLIQHAPGEAAP